MVRGRCKTDPKSATVMGSDTVAKDWKELLLRSGVPLEYDVARVLANEGFDVDADFPYMRRDVGGSKEHSVDLQASLFDEPTPEDLLCIRLLIECKYRSPEKKLLLLQDPNVSNPIRTLGGTVIGFDKFMPFYLDGEPLVAIERELPVAYKGVELHSNDAVEGDFSRALHQLRYGVPALVRRSIEFSMFGHPVDWHPLFFGKVLVTNAPIILVNEDTGVEAVRNAKDIEGIGKEIDVAVMVSGYGPDYERHFRKVFEDGRKDLIKGAKLVKKLAKAFGKKLDSLSDPVHVVKGLCSGRSYETQALSSQFFVCNTKGLPGLVRRIRAMCSLSYAGRSSRSHFGRVKHRSNARDNEP
jgi:hypothetical protein